MGLSPTTATLHLPKPEHPGISKCESGPELLPRLMAIEATVDAHMLRCQFRDVEIHHVPHDNLIDVRYTWS
jgi:hypothetical protein